MKTYHVGHVKLFNRYKTLADALAVANDDDTIVLHKNIKETVYIDKDIILKGNNHTLTVPSGKSGLYLRNFARIEDLKIKTHSRSNALVITEGAELINVTTQLIGPIREFYPVVWLKQGKLELQGGVYQSIYTAEETTLVANDTKFENYYGGDLLLTNHEDFSNINGEAIMSGCYLSYVHFSNAVSLNQCYLERFVVTKNAVLNNCVFSEVIPNEKCKLTKEPKHGPLSDLSDNRYILSASNQLTINKYHVENINEKTYGIYAYDCQLNVNNVNNATHLANHYISNCNVAFDNVQDENYWEFLNKSTTAFVKSKINQNQQIETALEKLNKMIGLTNVKESITSILNTIALSNKRHDKNFEFSNHMIFAGDPGTGKTTIAKIVAEALFEVGAIPQNKCTEVTVDSLIKGYVGQTASHVREILDSALGGVLFIDEAYQLTVKDGQNTFNDEALSVIIRYMEDHRSDLVVIVAGYSKEMKEFLASNIGLSRRFQWIEFDDYDANEMTQIFEMIRASYDDNYNEPDLPNVLPVLFNKLIALNLATPDSNGRITNGGNGGLVRNVYQRIAQARNNRVMKDDSTYNLTREDIKTGFMKEIQQIKNRQI